MGYHGLSSRQITELKSKSGPSTTSMRRLNNHNHLHRPSNPESFDFTDLKSTQDSSELLQALKWIGEDNESKDLTFLKASCSPSSTFTGVVNNQLTRRSAGEGRKNESIADGKAD